MPAKVFISCGQNSPQERQVAQDLSAWFQAQGYQPYVAIQVMSILDLNQVIFHELKTSDYYLFINFQREQLIDNAGVSFRRGSLYTNQELALAYAMGFDRMLMLNQEDVRKEGVFNFLVTNIPEFQTFNEVLPLVQNAVQVTGWTPAFTRQLRAGNLSFGKVVNAGGQLMRFLHLAIRNERPDIGAGDCVMRLASFGQTGQPPQIFYDRTLLKVTNAPVYQQMIWPLGSGTFDMLAIDAQNGSDVFLVSAHDITPRTPLIVASGSYDLEYEVFSQGFPMLTVRIRLVITGNVATATATLLP